MTFCKIMLMNGHRRSSSFLFIYSHHTEAVHLFKKIVCWSVGGGKLCENWLGVERIPHKAEQRLSRVKQRMQKVERMLEKLNKHCKELNNTCQKPNDLCIKLNDASFPPAVAHRQHSNRKSFNFEHLSCILLRRCFYNKSI